MFNQIIDLSHWQTEKDVLNILTNTSVDDTLFVCKAGDFTGNVTLADHDIHLKDFLRKALLIKKDVDHLPPVNSVIPYFFITVKDNMCHLDISSQIMKRIASIKKADGVIQFNKIVIDIESYTGDKSHFSKTITTMIKMMETSLKECGISIIWYMPKFWYDQISNWCKRNANTPSLEQNINSFVQARKWIAFYPDVEEKELPKLNFYKQFQFDHSIIAWQYSSHHKIPNSDRFCDISLVKNNVYN